MAAETTTYRGSSVEELLPLIREELGADAVIVRRREGIVGGIGGFFGKKCVEIEARPAGRDETPSRPSMPTRSIVDAYDTGGFDEDGFAPVEEDETLVGHNPLLETLMAQTSPFAEQLSEAMLEPLDEPEPFALETPAPLPEPDYRRRLGARPVEAPRLVDDPAAVIAALRAAAVPAALAEQIVAEAEQALRPFDPHASTRELARRALARRISVSHGRRTRRRTIALVGLPGSGRTLTAAKLCAAYARAGRRVAALSLEPARTAMRYAELTEDLGVPLEVADSPDLARRAKRRLRSSEIVVVDAPPLAAGVGGKPLRKTLALLDALHPDETHLLVPVSVDRDAAERFLEVLSRRLRPSRLLLTHADVLTPNGVGVGLSLATRTPVSFVASGDRPGGGIAPAEPAELAGMVLR